MMRHGDDNSHSTCYINTDTSNIKKQVPTAAVLPEVKPQTKMSIDSVPKYIILPPPKIPAPKVYVISEVNYGFYSLR